MNGNRPQKAPGWLLPLMIMVIMCVLAILAYPLLRSQLLCSPPEGWFEVQQPIIQLTLELPDGEDTSALIIVNEDGSATAFTENGEIDLTPGSTLTLGDEDEIETYRIAFLDCTGNIWVNPEIVNTDQFEA